MPVFSKFSDSDFYLEDTYAPTADVQRAVYDDTPTLWSSTVDYMGLLNAEQSETPPLTREEIDKKVGKRDLDIEEGSTAEYTDYLIKAKDNEMLRKALINRARPGISSGVSQLSASFAATLHDPAELAVSMIPVIGQAKYARLMAGAVTPLQRAGVRASVGALSGAVGAAAVEPFIYGMQSELQAEYDINDSLMSVAFGGIMGGGLHAGGGLIKDRFFRAPADSPTGNVVDNLDMETKQSALHLSLSQTNEGYNITLDDVLNADPRYGLLEETVGQRKNLDPDRLKVKRQVSAAVRSEIENRVLDVESQFNGAILSRADLKDMKSQLKDKKVELEKAVSDVGKRSADDPLYEAFDLRRVEAEKAVIELEAQLKSQAELEESRRSLASEPERAMEILDEGLQGDMRDWPSFLRDMVDEELKATHLAQSPDKLRAAIANAEQSRSVENFKYGVSNEVSELADQRVKSYNDETGLDESIADVEDILQTRAKQDPNLAKALDSVRESFKDEDVEARKLESAAKQWSACKVLNG